LSFIDNKKFELIKSLRIFGGIQLYQIALQLVKSKIIAILLGPAGIGLLGILNNSISLISTLTGLSLNSSLANEVSGKLNSHDKNEIAKIASSGIRIILITAFLGASAVIIFSPFISYLTFGTKDYSREFYWVSITVILIQVSSGYTGILQGLGERALIAKSSMFSTTIGFLLSVPIFFFFPSYSVAPTLFISALSTYLVTSYYYRKLNLNRIKISVIEAISGSSDLIRMGIVLTITTFFGFLVLHFIRLNILTKGGLEDVGLYSAGYSIVFTFLGMIFNSMGTDYFPRLSSVVKSNGDWKGLVNLQLGVTSVYVLPLIVFFVFTIEKGVVLFYSSEFLPVVEMMIYSSVGLYFRAITWPIGYMFLAANGRISYLINEILSGFYLLTSSFYFYNNYGLTGLGYSVLLTYFLTFLQVLLFSFVKYKFTYDLKSVRTILFNFLLLIFTVLCHSLTLNFIYALFLMIYVSFNLYTFHKK
jgi:O-antigen/teichoic acid export membrane protein